MLLAVVQRMLLVTLNVSRAYFATTNNGRGTTYTGRGTTYTDRGTTYTGRGTNTYVASIHKIHIAQTVVQHMSAKQI